MRHILADRSQRGLGITTLQIKAAPQGAIYIWPNSHLQYPTDLARKLGRDDLKFFSKDALDRQGYLLQGLTYSDIIIDHSLEPEDEDFYVIRKLRQQRGINS